MWPRLEHMCIASISQWLPVLNQFRELLQTLRDETTEQRCLREACLREGPEVDKLSEEVYETFDKAGEQPRKEGSVPEANHRSREKPARSAEGVRVGGGVKMPRVPAVYPRKCKW